MLTEHDDKTAATAWSRGGRMVPAIRSGFVPTPSGSAEMKRDEAEKMDDGDEESDEEYGGEGNKKTVKKEQTTNNNRPFKSSTRRKIKSQQPLPSTRSESFCPLIIASNTDGDDGAAATETRKSFSEASGAALARRRRFHADHDTGERHVSPRKRCKFDHVIDKDGARTVMADGRSRSDGKLVASKREVLPRRAKSIGGYSRGTSSSTSPSNDSIATRKQPKPRSRPFPKPCELESF